MEWWPTKVSEVHVGRNSDLFRQPAGGPSFDVVEGWGFSLVPVSNCYFLIGRVAFAGEWIGRRNEGRAERCE